jgi:hypothetical protein
MFIGGTLHQSFILDQHGNLWFWGTENPSGNGAVIETPTQILGKKFKIPWGREHLWKIVQ